MGPLAHFLMVYFFPFQLVVGLVGNAFNLLVLLDRQMRSRTNTFLAAVAVADILFLSLMAPYTIKYNHFLRSIKLPNLLLQYANPHLTALINMCAFASTWFLVAVCFERLLAVRWPLRARTFWGDKSRPSRIIAVICVFSLLVTMHSHFTHRTIEVEVQGRTVLRSIVRPSMERYWRMATVVQTVLQVFIPVFLVAITSLLMADALFSFLPPLRRGKGKALKIIQNATVRTPPTPHVTYTADRVQPPPAAAVTPQNNNSTLLNVPRDSVASRNASQRRATFVVLIIAMAFALFHLPSTVIYIWELMDTSAPTSATFINLATMANSLVVSGKMANFFLFCMSSSNFRRRLKQKLLSEYSSRTNTTRTTSTLLTQLTQLRRSSDEDGNRCKRHLYQRQPKAGSLGSEHMRRSLAHYGVQSPRATSLDTAAPHGSEQRQTSSNGVAGQANVERIPTRDKVKLSLDGTQRHDLHSSLNEHSNFR